MFRKLIFPWFTLLVVSCSSPQVEFIPHGKTLPDAKVGVPYNQEILIGTNLEDNPEFVTSENAKIYIYPTDIGLQVHSTKKRRDGLPIYNFLSISGVPLKPGVVIFSISGFIYGSMYTKNGEFNKTYSFEVK